MQTALLVGAVILHLMNMNIRETGWWSQYAKNPTDGTIVYRGYDPTEVDGFIAVPDCDRVGDYALAYVNGEPYHVRVFDCLGAWDGGDPSWWTENNIIGELGYYLAVKAGVVGQGGVEAAIIWLPEVTDGKEVCGEGAQRSGAWRAGGPCEC